VPGPDAPDYTNAVTATQRLLGAFGELDNPITIDLPPTVTALLIFLGPSPDPPTPTVVGANTDAEFPVYTLPGATTGGNSPVVAIVSPIVDSQVIITWASDPPDWWVVGDTSFRVVLAMPITDPGE
jgi:hypothetical protein